MADTPVPTLWLHELTHRYAIAEGELTILEKAEMAIWPGEMVALVAPSGTGKSTLLHLAGLLDTPQEGEVYIHGRATTQLDDAIRTALRRDDIGFVYQFHHLLPEFSACENVMLPQIIKGLSRHQARERAEEVLAFMGLAARFEHRPGELSGGEQQRVAIARAVANAPRLLLADEPTGNLDPHTAGHVFGALEQLVKSTGLSALIATHNQDLAARMDRRITIYQRQIYALP